MNTTYMMKAFQKSLTNVETKITALYKYHAVTECMHSVSEKQDIWDQSVSGEAMSSRLEFAEHIHMNFSSNVVPGDAST